MRQRGFARVIVCLGIRAAVGADGCKSNGTQGVQSGLGICADTCPRSCNVDNDCDVTRGDLCCDHGSQGKICQSASSCPRFCSADNQCQTAMSEACVRFSLEVTSRVCDQPRNALTICANDQACQTGEKCCGIYSEHVCLPANRCPKICTTNTDCNTTGGEICCTTLDALDPTL